jgi:hypothetical protein
MSHATNRLSGLKTETLPQELMELRERVLAQAGPVRAELEPLIEEALEQARFRGRVLTVARGALQQFKLDLELTRFDLDVTRRERAELLRMLGDRDEDD